MKTIFKFFMLISLIFTFAFAKDNSLTQIKDKGEFVVGLDDTFAPMGFRNNKGEIVGFDIDLAKEVSRRMGVKAVFVPCDWDGILFNLRSKKIDAIWNGLTITETRAKQIAFSDPYFNDDQIILVKGKNIKTLDDLKNKNIGLQMGSSAYFALENSPLAKEVKDIKKYPSNVEALLDLEAGRTDAVVMDSVVAKYYISKKPEFRILGQPLKKEKIAVGLRKNDIALRNEINSTLTEIKNDGTFNKIYVKWFGNK